MAVFALTAQNERAVAAMILPNTSWLRDSGNQRKKKPNDLWS
jgi:hypothetical protein